MPIYTNEGHKTVFLKLNDTTKYEITRLAFTSYSDFNYIIYNKKSIEQIELLFCIFFSVTF